MINIKKETESTVLELNLSNEQLCPLSASAREWMKPLPISGTNVLNLA